MRARIGAALTRLRGHNGRSGESALAQIDALTEENRRDSDPLRESRLVELRNRAYEELDLTPPARAPEMLDEAPAGAADLYEVKGGLPEIDASDLSAEVIAAAFLEHGSLLVRGLVPSGSAEELARGIDRAFEGRDAYAGGAPADETTPWFQPFTPAPAGGRDKQRERVPGGAAVLRNVAGGASLWAADSPRMMFELLEAFEQAGVKRMVSEYLGERPVFSMKKSVLRRVSPGGGTAWHQDGAFLGEGLRTLNVWLALSHCGDTAPGLDVVPRRLPGIVPTGTEGSMFDWSVSDELVEKALDGAEPATPIFEPGDVLFFDHLCLHRTATDPGMTGQRYATETWCFAGSSYPAKQVPLVV